MFFQGVSQCVFLKAVVKDALRHLSDWWGARGGKQSGCAHGFWSPAAWDHIPALPHSSWVTLSKLLQLSVPQFPHLYNANGDNHVHCIIYVNFLEQCSTHSSLNVSWHFESFMSLAERGSSHSLRNSSLHLALPIPRPTAAFQFIKPLSQDGLNPHKSQPWFPRSNLF